MLTVERLREMLDFDPETGVFQWRRTTSNRVSVCSCAGHSGRKGYIYIRLDRRLYRAHRLAWLYQKGLWPVGQIDHINGVACDNRFINLREASHAENQRNTGIQKNSTSGLKGVSWSKKDKRWIAQITFNRKHYYLGGFKSKEEAHKAYCASAKQHFGNFANDGNGSLFFDRGQSN